MTSFRMVFGQLFLWLLVTGSDVLSAFGFKSIAAELLERCAKHKNSDWVFARLALRYEKREQFDAAIVAQLKAIDLH